MCLYVDDMLITSGNIAVINSFKKKLMTVFEMTDLGRVNYFLGMEFLYESRGIILQQMKYADEILKIFKMQDSNSAVTPVE